VSRTDQRRNLSTFDVEGRALAYCEAGEGIPILWIHGYPLSGEIFRDQTAIAGARHVIPDLFGFGRSAPPPGAMTMDRYANHVLALADGLSLDRFVVAGLSMGGYVALAVQRAASHRIDGMILIDTRATADTPEGRSGRMDSIAEVESAGTSGIVERMLPQLIATDDPDIRNAVLSIMESASPEGVIAALGAMADRPDSTGDLRALHKPALVIVGELDAITPPEVAASMAATLTDATLVTIPGAGHLTTLEAPELVNDAVADWLSQRVTSGAPA